MPDRRRIVIALGERTTEMHCNGCQFEVVGAGYCNLWSKRLAMGAPIVGSKGGREYERLPECRSAELPALPSGCTCTTQLRNGDARVLDRRCPVHGNRSHLTLLPGAKGWARD